MELEKKLHSKVKEDYSSYSIGFKQQQKPNNFDAFFRKQDLSSFASQVNASWVNSVQIFVLETK